MIYILVQWEHEQYKYKIKNKLVHIIDWTFVASYGNIYDSAHRNKSYLFQKISHNRRDANVANVWWNAILTTRRGTMMSAQPYFKPDGQPRAATSDEKLLAEQQKNSCISGVVQARDAAKVNDISSSLLFLFLGLGVLIGKRFF